VANNTVSRWELGQRSIPEFLPLALETIERRLSESTAGSKAASTVGSIDNKPVSTAGSISKKINSTAGSKVKSTVGSSDLSATDNEVWLSTNAVAERLKISRKSVNDYILDGKLLATKGGDIPNHKGNRTHNFIKLDDVLIYESVYLS
jgi:hypothetical protein